jgi:hypothetical protein
MPTTVRDGADQRNGPHEAFRHYRDVEITREAGVAVVGECVGADDDELNAMGSQALDETMGRLRRIAGERCGAVLGCAQDGALGAP